MEQLGSEVLALGAHVSAYGTAFLPQHQAAPGPCIKHGAQRTWYVHVRNH
jgi:hypothetical protein